MDYMLLTDAAETINLQTMVNAAPAPAPMIAFARIASAPDYETTVNSAGGNDKITGTSGADRLAGDTGRDYIDSGAGNDVIRGGGGADRVKGGSGNDTFVFYKGDLVSAATHNGQMDHIADFHGAGGYKAWAGVEDDFITFFGFTDGHLEFDHAMRVNGMVDSHLQVYNIFDADGFQGNLLVQMADATAHLTAGDYKFYL